MYSPPKCHNKFIKYQHFDILINSVLKLSTHSNLKSYLLYSLMAPSVSPREFFATHLYEPNSEWVIGFMYNFIDTLYSPSSVTFEIYFPPEINNSLINYDPKLWLTN